MIYYAKLSKQGSRSYLVEFPELEGCLTEGKSKSEALKYAKEALDGWLASNCDRNLNIPEEKVYRSKSYYPIEVDMRVSFAITLRRARLKRKMSQTDVAKELGITQQAYAKLESPDKANPSLSTIQRLSEALGVGFELNLVA